MPSAGVHPLLRLVRPGNTLVSFVGTLVGGLAARGAGLAGGLDFAFALVLAAISTACVTAGGNVLNDLGDQASDRVNHPDRPLVTGEVSTGTARTLLIGLFAVSALAILPIAPAHLWLPVILAAALGSLVAYERWFKARGLPGNALVAFLTAAVFLYGGAVTATPAVMVPFAGMAFMATLSREVIKDMEDVAGDVDRATLPRTHGLPTAGAVARLAVGTAIGLSLWPFAGFVGWASAAGIMYLALVLAADALFVVSVLWLPTRLHQEQTLSKGAMTVALVAFLAVAFR